MNILSPIKKHLGLKLFLSYLAVILVLIFVLVIAVEFITPFAFENHMGLMDGQSFSGMGMGMMNSSNTMMSLLYENFRSGVNEAMLIAALAAFMAAVGVSALVSKRVVAPVQELMSASKFIAEGHYGHRVQIKEQADAGDELTRLGLSFNQMAEALDKTETMRRQLIGDVSHELRTPLTAIKGSLEGLIDGVVPATPETFQSIVRETDRLQRLVANLQELSQVEAGVVPLQPLPKDVVPIIKTVVKRLSPQFAEKEISVKIDLQEDLPQALIDEDRLAQVLVNLLGNALQNTPKDGQVKVSAKADPKEIMVSICDTGVGLQHQELELIFTRFYRVDKSRARASGGSGIGLTIARHLVELHGGKLWAESEGSGHGSQFHFTLPIYKLKL